MNGIREALQGKKTYTIVGLFVVIVALERFVGIDLPYIEIGDDWVEQLMIMLGIGTTRAAVARS
ncbi:hypothetical protein [Nostoc phage Nsp-JY18]